MLSSRGWGWGLLAALALAGGCEQPGPATYPVAGSVTWNGAPLEQGRIIFEPVENSPAAPISGEIRQGRFSLRSEPGEKVVRVYAEHEVGDPDPVMGARRRESFIPPRYGDRSELRATVTDRAADNQFPFDLSAP